MFKNIAGYDDVKEELLKIKSWIINRKKFKNKSVKLPKGILFYGRPGNGKTLFLKEYSKSFNLPILSISGNETNSCSEILKVFRESKKNDFTIILIDEIDLLLSKKEDCERILLGELDGVDSVQNILVLATTNSLHSLNSALLRSGRFDRTIEIGYPDIDSRKRLLELYIGKLKIKGDINTKYLSKIISGTNGADIMSILNDAYLRCGNKVTTDDIEDSFYRIMNSDFSLHCSFDPLKANPEIAYHEVAHALIMYKNKNIFTFYKAFFGKNCLSGYARSYPTNEHEHECSEYCFEEIEICLAGYVMTKLKFNKLDSGSISDLQKSRDYAVKLVNKLGYNGPESVLPYYSDQLRMESWIRKRKNEHVIESIIKRSQFNVKKYLKKHMKEAESLASIMMNKGYIDADDLKTVMEQ